MNCKKIVQNLYDFIQTQVENAKAKGVVIGLSGGIDSALVATLASQALPQGSVFALLMPSNSSSKANLDDALMLCQDLKLEYKIIEIQNILNAFLQHSQNPNSLRIGNFSARIRMCLLYEYSALRNALVIGTSNKSELLLGYGTIYGDLAYAFNPIGGLYKSDIYELAKYLNLHKNFINKAPSADLWENQSDESELGFSYERIDRGLKALEKNDKQALQSLEQNLIHMLKMRIQHNAFKRTMPKIADLADFNE